MKKLYLISDDEFSGKVVITCETKKEIIDTYIPTRQEINSAMYLGREIPKQMQEKTLYIVKVFYHYELGKNNQENLLREWKTFDKNEANKFFKDAIFFTK